MHVSAEMPLRPNAPDSLGALVPGPVARIAGNPQPNLAVAGHRFVVKDVIDVAGFVTGAGNPDWARTHAPATVHAAVVQLLLDAGCSLVGKAQCAELACSLSARNVHYGTPRNRAAPAREPGGSSSRPAAAVAGELCDLGLATDTLGSIHIPASYCWLYGFRPTHGAISTTGVMPLAQSFDTVGLLARDATLLRTAALLLLSSGEDRCPARLHIATDAFAALDGPCQQALAPTLDRMRNCLSSVDSVVAAPASMRLDDCMAAFRDLEAAEVWANYGAWITATQPRFGPDVAERLGICRPGARVAPGRWKRGPGPAARPPGSAPGQHHRARFAGCRRPSA
jgi:amidase